MKSDRASFLLTSVLLIGLGLLSRSAIGLPPMFAKYAGSIIWGGMVYFVWASLFPRRGWRERGLVAALIAVVTEFSQLVHIEWIDAFRRTAIGVLLIGRFFSWGDVACYLIGIALAALFEKRVLKPDGA